MHFYIRTLYEFIHLGNQIEKLNLQKIFAILICYKISTVFKI